MIRRTRVAGTGTRFPTEAAVRAIDQLFERSFAADESGAFSKTRRAAGVAGV